MDINDKTKNLQWTQWTSIVSIGHIHCVHPTVHWTCPMVTLCPLWPLCPLDTNHKSTYTFTLNCCWTTLKYILFHRYNTDKKTQNFQNYIKFIHWPALNMRKMFVTFLPIVGGIMESWKWPRWNTKISKYWTRWDFSKCWNGISRAVKYQVVNHSQSGWLVLYQCNNELGLAFELSVTVCL